MPSSASCRPKLCLDRRSVVVDGGNSFRSHEPLLNYLGRVKAKRRAVNRPMVAVGAVMGGLGVEMIGEPRAVALAIVGFVIAALAAAFSPQPIYPTSMKSNDDRQT